MKRISLCTPAWRRHELTRLMMEQRAETFRRAAEMGVECQCVVISDETVLLDMAREFGFVALAQKNELGRRYNDGHEWAWDNDYDVSLQCNSDQVFTPEYLVRLAEQTEHDKITLTGWLTAVHESGKKSITANNPTWAMVAVPWALLSASRGRPIQDESLMSGCDRAFFQGIVDTNAPRLDARIDGDRVHEVTGWNINRVEDFPLDVIQFESGNQLTPWKRWLLVAMATGSMEQEVPWKGIELTHGPEFVRKMKGFYGIG